MPTQAKSATAAFCEVEVVCAFKSGGNIVPTTYTQSCPAVSLSLAKFLWTERTFSKERMIYSVGYKRMNERPVREGEIMKKTPQPTHNHHFVVPLPCSNACVVVLMKAGLPIS